MSCNNSTPPKHECKPITYTITQDVLKHVRINDVDYYTIEEIEKAIDKSGGLTVDKQEILNNLKK